MDKKKKVRDLFQEAIELPRELLKDVPRITVLGNENVWIENYKSIMEYDENYIRLSSDITILGQKLFVQEISEEDILITGIINSIEFE